MSNKNSIFCLFTSTSQFNKIFIIYRNYINEIIKNYNEFTIVNFCDFEKNKIKKKNNFLLKKTFGNKIKFIYPKNKNDFLNYIKNKKILGFDAIGKDFKDFKIRNLLNKRNISLILLINQGFISNEENQLKNLSIKNKKFLIINRLNRILYRIFILLNIFPKTDFYFETRKKIFEKFNNGKIRKLSHKFPIFKKILNFKRIFKINSSAYDDYLNFLNSNKKIKKKKIIFVDGNFKHTDILKREKINIEKLKQKYFKQLKITFNYLEKIFKKKIEICLHPSSNMRDFKNFFKKNKINKGNTKEKILDSHLVIFHESSAIMDAIVYNKKILILETGLMGNYILNRIHQYKDILKLPSLDMDKSIILKKSELLKKFITSKKYLKRYIKNNLNIDGQTPGYKKITRVLKTYSEFEI
jgi:hypothetical protein